MNWNELIRDFMAGVILLGMVAANVVLMIEGSEVPDILQSEELFGVLVGAIVLKESGNVMRRY